MAIFRILLVAQLVAIIVYTGVTVSIEGLNLVTPFFGAVFGMGWQGQFNFDFLMFLTLSGLWTAWRSGFTGGGLALGLAASVLGILFLSAYLLVLLGRESGDMRRVLLGVHADAN